MTDSNPPEINPLLNPDANTLKKPLLFSSKGFVIAIVFVGLAAIIALYSLFNLNSASNYQGLIKKVETQTQQLQNKGDN